MKKKFIESSLVLIKSKKSVDELSEKKLRYGLEGFYNLATKTIVMFLLSICFDTLLEFFLLTIVYSTLRLYGFGLHMKTSLQCWFTTVPIYIGGCILIKYTVFPYLLSVIIWTIGFLSFLFFAPADTHARPLIHKKKRIRAKILSLCILSSYFVLSFFIQNPVIHNVILYAIIMESISINPLVYRLLNMPFNNYKTYQTTV